MKVLLINGSPHQHGCTHTALAEVAAALQAAGAESEIFWLGTGPQQGCIACRHCFKTGRCVFDDAVNTLAQKLTEADGLVVGTPVYYAGPNGALCAVLDRLFYSAGKHFCGKPAAAVCSCRRAGATATLDRLNKYFTLAQMPVASPQYWPMVHGNTPKEVRQDAEGLQTMRSLGTNMAWMITAGATTPLPQQETPRQYTNFIR